MAISSIHIEAGKGGYFAHNSRENPTVNSIFADEENFCSCSKDEAFKTFRAELETRTEAYKKNYGRKKLHAKTIPHLSAIVNFNKDHTPADIKKVCDYLELVLDTKVIQYSMHRDEGHIVGDQDSDKKLHAHITEGKAVKNYHAHIELMGLDSTGASVRRKLTKPFLKDIQTKTAELLHMERGRESGYSKAQYTEIKAKLKPQDQYQDKDEYKADFNAAAKDLGYFKEHKKAKRLDTYEYKEHAKNTAQATVASTKDLKAEVAKLRAELKENGASRADYATLEAIVAELKEQVKSKSVTIEELHLKLSEALQATKRVQGELVLVQVVQKRQEEQIRDADEVLEDGTKYIGAESGFTMRRMFQWFKDKIDSLKARVQELEAENKELREAQVDHPTIGIVSKISTTETFDPFNDPTTATLTEQERKEAFNKAFPEPRARDYDR